MPRRRLIRRPARRPLPGPKPMPARQLGGRRPPFSPAPVGRPRRKHKRSRAAAIRAFKHQARKGNQRAIKALHKLGVSL